MIAITPRSAGRRWGTVSFASTLHLEPILDLLLTDVPSRWKAEVRLGLQEALVNAAKHGNQLDPNKTVVVEFFILDDEYWWIVADQGGGFETPCDCGCPDSDNALDALQGCGRGLFILHQIFDQVHWNPKGTELRLCKQVRTKMRLPLVS